MNSANFIFFSLLVGAAGSSVALAADDAAVTALLKKNNCSKCHAIDKKKVGAPYKEISKKYAGVAGAEQKLYLHLTTQPKVDVDGVEEAHMSLKARSDAELRDAIKWILSR